jgi:hypothetical protein
MIEWFLAQLENACSNIALYAHKARLAIFFVGIIFFNDSTWYRNDCIISIRMEHNYNDEREKKQKKTTVVCSSQT